VTEKVSFQGVTRFEDRRRLPLGVATNFSAYAAKVLTQARARPVAPLGGQACRAAGLPGWRACPRCQPLAWLAQASPSPVCEARGGTCRPCCPSVGSRAAGRALPCMRGGRGPGPQGPSRTLKHPLKLSKAARVERGRRAGGVRPARAGGVLRGRRRVPRARARRGRLLRPRRGSALLDAADARAGRAAGARARPRAARALPGPARLPKRSSPLGPPASALTLLQPAVRECACRLPQQARSKRATS